jgi:hypothetical protein
MNRKLATTKDNSTRAKVSKATASPFARRVKALD